MPLKRLGNLKQDEGNKHIPRSGFEEKEQTHPCWNSGQYYWLQIMRETLLHLPYVSQNVSLWPVSGKKFLFLFFFFFPCHDKKDIKFLFKGWIAKFLFLCLKCLWNFDFAAEWLHHRSWSQKAWYWCLFGGGDAWKLFSCLEVIQLPQFYVKYLRQLFWSSSEFCIHQNWVASEPVWTDCISISVLLLSISKLFF